MTPERLAEIREDLAYMRQDKLDLSQQADAVDAITELLAELKRIDTIRAEVTTSDTRRLVKVLDLQAEVEWLTAERDEARGVAEALRREVLIMSTVRRSAPVGGNMTDDAVKLTDDEAVALAWRLLADSLADPPDWLDWGNVPLLDEASFDAVVRAVGTNVARSIRHSTAIVDRVRGVDSRALKARAS